jgi:thiol-disulfide isomerase/thioredoxin
MKKWLTPIVLLAGCAGVYLLARHHQKASAPIGSRPSQIAPQFSLQDLNGRPLNLADYRGKVVLLNFWATWCEPCRHEIPEFIQLQNNSPGLQILGISLDDSTEPVRNFYTEFKMNYPVAVGDAALAQRYGGILGLPISFIIGCDGRVASKHIGEVNIPEITAEINSLRKSWECAPTSQR